MTLNETEDIAKACRGRAGWRPPAVDRELLLSAAEAIEYLEQFEP